MVTRGCRCATSPKELRRSLPRRSSSAVPSWAFRPGHVSNRQKAKPARMAAMRTTMSKAVGHEILAEAWNLDIRAGALNLDVLVVTRKKYRPPRPMDVKGGCSPQNNLENWGPSNRA